MNTDDVQISTEERIAQHVQGFEFASGVDPIEEDCAELGRELLRLIAQTLTPEDLAALRRAYGIAA